ncbi:MAG: MraY family glycosyltransferase [Chitinophagales bacterium]
MNLSDFDTTSISFQLTTYFVFFIVAVFFTTILSFLFLKFLKNIGTRQHNNGQENLVRWASQTKPKIGGFCFFMLFLLSVCSYFLLPFHSESFFNRELLALLGSASLGFIVGLVDDSYNTPPRFKFLGQLACAAVMIVMGVIIPISNIWLIDVLFTTFWVVGVMNSINMLDNMDGITASVSAFILVAALAVLYLQGALAGFYVIVIVGVLAALVSYLYFNWHPSKMYMGDSGSQFLGAFLSVISILYMWQFRGKMTDEVGLSLQQFVLPILVFMLPIIDTTTVFVRRIRRGQSPFVGGRDHTTHHLAYCGLKDNQVAWVFVALATVSVIFTYFIVRHFLTHTWNTSLSILALGYVLAIFVGMQYFYEIGKRKKLINHNQS